LGAPWKVHAGYDAPFGEAADIQADDKTVDTKLKERAEPSPTLEHERDISATLTSH